MSPSAHNFDVELANAPRRLPEECSALPDRGAIPVGFDPDDFELISGWQELATHFAPHVIEEIRVSSLGGNTSIQGHAYIRSAVAQAVMLSKTTCDASFFYSKKMGMNLILEDSHLELPTIWALETDQEVIGYFDWPPHVHVQRHGDFQAFLHFPSYLSVRRKEVAIIDCEAIHSLVLKNLAAPSFYVHEGDRWVCPSLQAAFEHLGMRHEIWTEDTIRSLKRNC